MFFLGQREDCRTKLSLSLFMDRALPNHIAKSIHFLTKYSIAELTFVQTVSFLPDTDFSPICRHFPQVYRIKAQTYCCRYSFVIYCVAAYFSMTSLSHRENRRTVHCSSLFISHVLQSPKQIHSINIRTNSTQI